MCCIESPLSPEGDGCNVTYMRRATRSPPTSSTKQHYFYLRAKTALESSAIESNLPFFASPRSLKSRDVFQGLAPGEKIETHSCRTACSRGFHVSRASRLLSSRARAHRPSTNCRQTGTCSRGQHDTGSGSGARDPPSDTHRGTEPERGIIEGQHTVDESHCLVLSKEPYP